MFNLVVTAPGGRKAEIECEASATFADVKKEIEQALGVPPDKQKLLCNGKERKNGTEKLSDAGVTGKSKLMLMLAPGFQLPPPQSVSTTSNPIEETPNSSAEPEPFDLECEMPVPDGNAMEDGRAGVVHIKQGKNKYHVKVPHGLAAATFGDLASYLVSKVLFPPGIPAAELRFISKGKTADGSQQVGDSATSETTVMLLFREGFHLAAEGDNWLRERSAELTEAETEIEKLGKRIDANFIDDETPIRLLKVSDLVGTLKQSIEIVRVRETVLPEMGALRERVLKIDARVEELRRCCKR